MFVCRIFCASGTGMVDLKENGMQIETCPDVVRFHKCAQNKITMYYLKKKKSDNPKKRQASQATLVKKLDKVFSQYIRLRDAFPNGTFRCISCGRIKPFEQADAGHYHSRKHMSTRFDEENVSSECRACNRFSADHLIGYRENLIRKIGTQRFQLLEVKAHQTKKWSCFELEQLIKYYSVLVKKLSDEKGIRI